MIARNGTFFNHDSSLVPFGSSIKIAADLQVSPISGRVMSDWPSSFADTMTTLDPLSNKSLVTRPT